MPVTPPLPVRKAVIPAAGLGTRFLPATKCSPKEMLPVVDRPAIQYVVEEAVQAGLTDILIITGSNKRGVSRLRSLLAGSGSSALWRSNESVGSASSRRTAYS